MSLLTPHPLTTRETFWLTGFVLMLIAACWLPPLAQDPGYHHFADQGHWGGIAHPLDVLSNLPFGILGVWGLLQVRQHRRRDGSPGSPSSPSAHALRYGAVFFAGLLATSFGSAWYHLNPTDATLLWDRAGMALAFVGVLSLLAATQVSERAAPWTFTFITLASLAAIWAWMANANLLPWVLLQGLGLVLILCMGMLKPLQTGAPVRWIWLAVAYGLAKACELHDHEIASLLDGAFTGHALKHLLASAAAIPVLLGFQMVRD